LSLNGLTSDSLFYKLILIFFGAMLGVVITEISTARQRKIDKEQKREEIRNNIISETLRFVFRINEVLNDLWADKQVFENKQKTSPQDASKYEQIMLKRFDENMSKNIFAELNLQSYHLKRLEDQTLWRDFENLMNALRSLTDEILLNTDIKKCGELDKKLKNLKKSFVEKCIELTKV